MKFIHLDKTYSVVVKELDNEHQITIDGKNYDIDNCIKKENMISFELDKEFNNIYFAIDKDTIFLALRGDYYTVTLDQGISFRNKRAQVQQGDSVHSPMPGLLVKVMVEVGDKVKQGTTLAIVEAMKMQNELRAPRDGTIKQINNQEGDQVEALKPIVELEMKEDV